MKENIKKNIFEKAEPYTRTTTKGMKITDTIIKQLIDQHKKIGKFKYPANKLHDLLGVKAKQTMQTRLQELINKAPYVKEKKIKIKVGQTDKHQQYTFDVEEDKTNQQTSTNNTTTST